MLCRLPRAPDLNRQPPETVSAPECPCLGFEKDRPSLPDKADRAQAAKHICHSFSCPAPERYKTLESFSALLDTDTVNPGLHRRFRFARPDAANKTVDTLTPAVVKS